MEKLRAKERPSGNGREMVGRSEEGSNRIWCKQGHSHMVEIDKVH